MLIVPSSLVIITQLKTISNVNLYFRFTKKRTLFIIEIYICVFIYYMCVCVTTCYSAIIRYLIFFKHVEEISDLNFN